MRGRRKGDGREEMGEGGDGREEMGGVDTSDHAHINARSYITPHPIYLHSLQRADHSIPGEAAS